MKLLINKKRRGREGEGERERKQNKENEEEDEIPVDLVAAGKNLKILTARSTRKGLKKKKIC